MISTVSLKLYSDQSWSWSSKVWSNWVQHTLKSFNLPRNNSKIWDLCHWLCAPWSWTQRSSLLYIGEVLHSILLIFICLFNSWKISVSIMQKWTHRCKQVCPAGGTVAYLVMHQLDHQSVSVLVTVYKPCVCVGSSCSGTSTTAIWVLCGTNSLFSSLTFCQNNRQVLE